MKSVLIIPFNTDLNRGDQALVWESIRLIRDVYEEPVNISLIESGNSKIEIEQQTQQTKLLGYHFCDPILRHPGRFFHDSSKQVDNGVMRLVKWGGIAFFDFCKTCLLLLKWKWINRLGYRMLSERAKETLQILKKADCVIVKGGGFIHAYGKVTDAYQMYYSTYTMLLAIRYKKQLIMLPNSIGPVKGFLSRYIVKRVLSGCKLLFVREKVSQRYLVEQFGRVAINTFDLGFYLQNKSTLNVTSYLEQQNINFDDKIIGITLRPWRFPNSSNPHEKYNSYVSTFVDFTDYLIKKGFIICFFVHTLGPSAHENDEIAVKEVVNKVQAKERCRIIKDFNLNCYDMMQLYSQCSYFIGTRFHSVIFAQNQNVPTISISYGGNKGTGIMADLGLSQYVLSIDEVEFSTLKNLFSSLEKNTDSYIEKLTERNLLLQEERLKLVTNIRKCLFSN